MRLSAMRWQSPPLRPAALPRASAPPSKPHPPLTPRCSWRLGSAAARAPRLPKGNRRCLHAPHYHTVRPGSLRRTTASHPDRRTLVSHRQSASRPTAPERAAPSRRAICRKHSRQRASAPRRTVTRKTRVRMRSRCGSPQLSPHAAGFLVLRLESRHMLGSRHPPPQPDSAQEPGLPQRSTRLVPCLAPWCAAKHPCAPPSPV
mmetsp:Transcript_14899/g.45543  ORF Transcript_14899/g.45543 Transcript_14899/m.45543 type:complete len:203 (+) Transcript_14899:551-1159(+)